MVFMVFDDFIEGLLLNGVMQLFLRVVTLPIMWLRVGYNKLVLLKFLSSLILCAARKWKQKEMFAHDTKPDKTILISSKHQLTLELSPLSEFPIGSPDSLIASDSGPFRSMGI